MLSRFSVNCWNGACLIAVAAACLAAQSGCDTGPKVTIAEPRVAPPGAKEAEQARQAQAEAAAAQAAAPATAPVQTPPADPAATKGSTGDAAKQDQAKAADAAVAKDTSSEASAAKDKAEPARRELPDDPNAWLPEDFRLAKANRDPRVIEAVETLGRSGAKADENAALLVELLRPELPGGQAALYTNRPQGILGLPAAIVNALGTNPSKKAKSALREIVMGKLTSDLEDKVFTVLALRALANYPSPETDSTLYAILTAPEAVRPPGRGSVTPEWLQKETVAMVSETATPKLRRWLGEYVALEATPASHRAYLVPMVTSVEASNLGAHCALAACDYLEDNDRLRIQRSLTAVARRSLDFLILVPDPSVIPPVASDLRALRLTVPDEELLAQNFGVVDQIWESEFLDSIYEKVAAVESPNASGDLLSIATSLPNSKLRASIWQLLNENWSDAENLLRTQQFSVPNMRDPGMLFVLKSMPRDDNYGEPRGGQTNRQLREARARQAWMMAVREMIRTLARRLEYAAKIDDVVAVRLDRPGSMRAIESADDFERVMEARRKEKKKSKADSDAKEKLLDIPLEITVEADVVHTYNLRWPEAMEGKVSVPVSPMHLYYAKLNLVADPEKLVSSLSKQMRNTRVHGLETGLWIDSTFRPEPRKLRSVDIYLHNYKRGSAIAPASSGKNRATPLRDKMLNLQVEILWIEIEDFTTLSSDEQA